MNHLLKSLRYKISQAKNTQLFRITLQYRPDAYYITSPHRKVFRKQIEQLEKNQSNKLLGGDNFPMNQTILFLKCEAQSIARSFVENSIYKQQNLLESYSIDEVEQLSKSKIQNLANFYQYK